MAKELGLKASSVGHQGQVEREACASLKPGRLLWRLGADLRIFKDKGQLRFG